MNDPHPRVAHRLGGQVVRGVGVPRDDLGHELRDHDVGVVPQLLQGGAEREAKPQPPDKHARSRRLPERRTGDLGEPVLGAMTAR